MIVCGLIKDANLRDRVQHLAATTGWGIWLAEEQETFEAMLTAVSPFPDAVVADDESLFQGLPATAAAWVYLGRQSRSNIAATAVDPQTDDATLVQQLKTCVNARRFRMSFARLDRTEPITSLPRHEELFQQLGESRGKGMGMVVIHLDHANHLYANLDPVSKTDLLAALGEHIRSGLPSGTRLGFYDAACFIVAVPDIEADAMSPLCRQLITGVRQPLRFQGTEIYITASIGYSYDAEMGDPEPLWAAAWQAMCVAAEQGGDRVRSATEGTVAERIPQALEREEFSLVMQAQWNIQGDRLRGVEALLRWQGMEVGELASSRFIPIAERHGHMARIGDWVLEHACREASTWFEHRIDGVVLAVNVSPQQFRNAAIRKQIERFRRERWLDPGMLELELSHENMLDLVDHQREQIYALRDRGVRFALDNLGSSLIDTSKLLRCPADTLKIDRRLVAAMITDRAAADLVAQICQLGQRLKLRVVAVGVENDQQLARLADFGCTDVQGYLFSKPVPLTEFRQQLVRPARPLRRH